MNFKLKKLISYYKPYKKTFFFDLFFEAFADAIAIFVPIIWSFISNKVIFFEHDTAINFIYVLSLFIILLLIVRRWCQHYNIYFGHLIGVKIERDMRNEIFAHIQKLSHDFFDNKNVGEIMSRITTDLSDVSEFLHHFPEDILFVTTRLVGISTVFFIVDYKLAIISTIIIIIICLYIVFFMSKYDKASRKSLASMGSINSQIEDSITGVRVSQSFVNEKLEIEKFKRANENFVINEKYSLKIMAHSFSKIFLLIMLHASLLVLIGSVFIVNDFLSISDLVFFVTYETILVGPLYEIMGTVETVTRSIAGYKRFVEILDIKPTIVDSFDAIKIKDFCGDVEIKNINFHYENEKTNVLKNFSTHINHGEYVALVGPSGAGKSTFCNLIPRFYDVSSGEILIDGINVKNIKLENLRKNIGFVEQNTFLFSGTIRDNIRYGKLDASNEEVYDAAKSAFAHDFIINLQDNYDTYIGSNGIKLSGGQKQRIAIARAFLKNPRILIFDEATSNLDNESERFIQKSMEELSKGRTTIVIAHRLSTIRNAHKILVISDGSIAEEGTHENLIQKNGIYADLYNSL